MNDIHREVSPADASPNHPCPRRVGQLREEASQVAELSPFPENHWREVKVLQVLHSWPGMSCAKSSFKGPQPCNLNIPQVSEYLREELLHCSPFHWRHQTARLPANVRAMGRNTAFVGRLRPTAVQVVSLTGVAPGDQNASIFSLILLYFLAPRFLLLS